jgi:hypothetical protein
MKKNIIRCLLNILQSPIFDISFVMKDPTGVEIKIQLSEKYIQ